MLFWGAHLDGIVLDIANGALDVFSIIEEDLPAWAAPYGVAVFSETTLMQEFTTCDLQMAEHFLGLMLVFTDQHVDVIGHDGAGVAGVSLAGDFICK